MTQNSNINHSSKKILDSTFLNQSVVSPIAVDASLTKTSRKRYAINNFFSRTELDLGKFNQSKLSNLYQSYYQQQQKGQVICLAYIDTQNNNKQIKITNQAINLFKKYEKNSITFIGNFGKKGSGKSFWYDKLLNLSDVQGAQYSKIENVPGLYIWSVPFVKNNLRIFLVDYSNSREGDNLSGEDQKLLDLQLILAQALVLLPQPQDKKQKVSDLAYTSFNSGMSRLSDKGSKTNKQSGYWPHLFYNLYRSVKSVSPQTDKLSYLFADYNYSIIHNALNDKFKDKVSTLSMMESSLIKGQSSYTFLNQRYVKRSSLVFKDIYKKLNGKKYENLEYTGQIVPYILRHAAKNLNSSKSVKVDKMFYDIKKDIYQRKLEAGKFVYNLNYDILKDKSVSQQDNKTSRSRSKSKSRTSQLKQSKNQSLKESKKNNPQVSQNKQKTERSSRLNQSLNKQTVNLRSSQGPTQTVKPKPQPLDDILNIFRRTNQDVLTHFDQTKYDQNLHQEYEKKLLQYGQTKQKEVLQYNKRQTYQVLSSTLPTFVYPQDKKAKAEPNSSSNPAQQLDYNAILSYVNQLKTSGMPLDHDRCTPVSEKLKDVGSYATKGKFFHVWGTEAYYKQRKLEMNVQDKKKQLTQLKGRNNEVLLLNSHHDNKATQLLDEHNRSTDKIQKLKNQVDLGRKINKNEISDQQYIKALQEHKDKLQKILKENQKKMKQLNKNIKQDPRAQLIQRKIDDKKALELQIQVGISNLLASKLNNSTSVLSSRKSQIRKIGDNGIKKSQFNKSMTK